MRTFFRQKISKTIPANLKVGARVAARAVSDLRAGYTFCRESSSIQSDSVNFSGKVTVSQPIRKTELLENKLRNLEIGIQRLHGVVVKPNEVFSFWRLVGSPKDSRGFLPGRNLRNGIVVPELGGGLCQLSSIIYHCALQAGLNIIERHSHSVDIYTEETRFTPLGADAAVSYGYRDLRFVNNLGFNICLEFQMERDQLSLSIVSEEPLQKIAVEFNRIPSNLGTTVEAVRSDTAQVVARSFYIRKGSV